MDIGRQLHYEERKSVCIWQTGGNKGRVISERGRYGFPEIILPRFICCPASVEPDSSATYLISFS